MEPGDGGAPTPRRRRKPTRASVPPSLAPPPSVRDGGAPPARRRCKPTGDAAPPSLAPSPSVRMGPGYGGAPTARRSRKPTGAAAPPSLAPPPSVRMAHGDGGTPPARKRKESLPLRGGKRGRRTDSVGSSSQNGSAGGRGGTESSAREDDGWEGLAGRGDDPNGSGEGGAGHTAHGSPDVLAAPSAPPENVTAARGRISMAHTPNIPPRFEGLLRSVSSLIPHEGKAKSYECNLSQMKTFLKWSKSEMALFFEWSDDEMEMTCRMHNIQKGFFFKFTVNAAFSDQIDNISVERAAVAFSTNFIANDEYWSGLKETLLNMFGSFEDEDLKEYDYLYVFSRVGNSICFRMFKITSLPKADDTSSGLWLKEINTTFCLKLVNDHGITNSSDIGQHLTENKTLTKFSLCPVYSNSDGQMGFCLSHLVDFSGTTYSIFLDNGPYVSSLEKLEGFNRSLAEIVVKEPLLKIKHIIGSATNRTHCFARRRCKSILQSLFAEFAMLLESGKCITEAGGISMHNVLASFRKKIKNNVLVRATEVKLYGLHVTNYSDELAENNVRSLVDMVRSCFLEGEIPIDMYDLLEDLEKDPLNEIRRATDDCSLLKAEERRNLLINLNSEYMTNVEAKSSGSDQINDGSSKINQVTFFDGCPNADDWNLIMKDNEYMVQVCNVEESSDNDEETDVGNQKANAVVMERMKKKDRMSKNTPSIRRMTKKKKHAPIKGKLQFSSKRNFQMHMPEKARKDGIFPFRLGLADYILTAYFPLFLRFVQKKMRQVKAQRE